MLKMMTVTMMMMTMMMVMIETFLAREDFCTVAWGEDEILVIGGYDDIGRQTR